MDSCLETTDFLHGRLARANRFGVIQYSVLEEFLYGRFQGTRFFLPVHTYNPFRPAVISSSLNVCTTSKNCHSCARAAGFSPRCQRNRTVLLLQPFSQAQRRPELNYELPNEIVISGIAYHFCVRIGGRLRRDPLHASRVRSARCGTDGSPRGSIQKRICPARSRDSATGKKHSGSERYRPYGD